MRRVINGGPFYNATETATTSAPSLATDGSACVAQTRGGDLLNSDEWTITGVFTGGSSPSVDFIPWIYTVDGAWVNGTKYTLKPTSDADGGAIIDIPASGIATRLYLQITAYNGTPTNVVMKAYSSEHDEAI